MSRRLAKTCHKQYKEMLKFIRTNKDLILKPKTKDYPQLAILWKQFAVHINSLGYGPPKTPKQWRHVLSEWKTNTRAKYQRIKFQMIRTEGKYTKGNTLNDLEVQLLSLLNSSMQIQIPEHREEEEEEEEEVVNLNNEIKYNISDIEADEIKYNISDIEADDQTNTQYILKQDHLDHDYIQTPLTEEHTSSNQSNQDTIQFDQSMSTLASALNNYTSTYKEIERAKLKLQYFEKFGTFDNFDSLFL